MGLHEAYKQTMSAQLKEWSAQIDLLEARGENAEADMKVRRAEELHALRAKQRAAYAKMKELGIASGEAWEQVKETAEKIWEELKTGIADAQTKFK
ncbi:MAG: hypothetical protein Q7S94_02195 [Gallionella sp.]|nr:hypothetical protein [Gallionella sp.]